MDFNEKKLSGDYLYRGKILNLKKDTVILPDGRTAEREVIEHSGGSAVYLEKDGKVLLVKQFRYPFNKELYEIPAGKINKGESPVDTAKRELLEECGIIAEDMKFLKKIYPSVGYTDEVIYLYKAEGIKASVQHLDEDEFLSVEFIDKTELYKMVDNGEICDAKTLVAILSEK